MTNQKISTTIYTFLNIYLGTYFNQSTIQVRDLILKYISVHDFVRFILIVFWISKMLASI